jgi:hypothetical protein
LLPENFILRLQNLERVSLNTSKWVSSSYFEDNLAVLVTVSTSGAKCTNSMEQSPSSEADFYSSTEEIPYIDEK